jgi:hypothetical protein
MMDGHTEREYLSLFSRHVQKLTGHGPQVKGVCPFHDDHNPSWVGNCVTGVWQCFGCQAKGTAEQFAGRTGEERETSNGYQQRRIVATYNYCD